MSKSLKTLISNMMNNTPPKGAPLRRVAKAPGATSQGIDHAL